MNLKKTILLINLTIYSLICYSQDYFIVANDTTFCTNLEYGTTGQGYLKSVRYTDANGNNIVIKGRKEVPDVLTFYRQGVFIDKVPQKANKPDSYIRYTERTVDGKLKVYSDNPINIGRSSYRSNAPNPLTMNNSTVSRPQNGSIQTTSGRVGVYRFFLKLPNGTFYKINSKKNMKKHIIPYLKKCNAFNNQYNGDFSTDEQPFMEMIDLYNSICN
ncbi:hypothetical protein AB9K26_07115 [Psychroserpens sp. XS_ASV72]|uniref:hypothetical protein n=1 Tax=Psychroserpens sp. XS_ASV72 TaxID=3241293 RepID=UPI0035133AFA